MATQVSTRKVKISYIMGSKAFKQGILDKLHNKPYRDDWKGNLKFRVIDEQWNYERGRMFCLYLQHNNLHDLNIKEGNKVTYNAQVAYRNAVSAGYIL